MPNSQRKRDKVEIDGRATSLRRANNQRESELVNTEILRAQVHDGSTAKTPWQASKAKRLAKRIASGKTYANWSARNAKSQPKPSVSNLSV